MINSTPGGQIVLAKYSVGEPDQRRTVAPRIEEVIRAIVDLGGTYPDVVQALQEAKAADSLTSRFEVDALPKAGRAYERVAESDGESSEPHLQANSPVPDLFSSSSEGSSSTSEESAPKANDQAESAESSQTTEKSDPSGSIFARILGPHRS